MSEDFEVKALLTEEKTSLDLSPEEMNLPGCEGYVDKVLTVAAVRVNEDVFRAAGSDGEGGLRIATRRGPILGRDVFTAIGFSLQGVDVASESRRSYFPPDIVRVAKAQHFAGPDRRPVPNPKKAFMDDMRSVADTVDRWLGGDSVIFVTGQPDIDNAGLATEVIMLSRQDETYYSVPLDIGSAFDDGISPNELRANFMKPFDPAVRLVGGTLLKPGRGRIKLASLDRMPFGPSADVFDVGLSGVRQDIDGVFVSQTVRDAALKAICMVLDGGAVC